MRTVLFALFAATLAACSGGSDPSTLSGDPPDQDVIAMEDLVHVLINDERVSNGVEALAHDAALRAVARAHSEDMIARDFFDHTNPDGDSPFDRMSDAGISYSSAGENIAWNRGYADPAEVAVTGWMNSTGHRNNILNAGFTHAGLGAAQDPSNGAWYFTQLFMRPSGNLVVLSWVAHRDFAADHAESSCSSHD